VEFVEAGITSGPDLLEVAHQYLDPLTTEGIDTLILGCTHYPLLTGVVSYVMGDQVTLVSSAEETAKDVYKLLVQRGLEREPALPAPEHRFLTTGLPDEFAHIGRRFLGPELESVHQLSQATSWVVV
jgi:glutamate racemase